MRYLICIYGDKMQRGQISFTHSVQNAKNLIISIDRKMQQQNAVSFLCHANKAGNKELIK